MYGRISGLLPQAGMTPVPRIALKTGADDHFELPLVKTFHDLCEIGNDRAAHSAGAVACSAKCGIAQPACIGRCIYLAVLHCIWRSRRRQIARELFDILHGFDSLAGDVVAFGSLRLVRLCSQCLDTGPSRRPSTRWPRRRRVGRATLARSRRAAAMARTGRDHRRGKV
jgi:hypothetical protein